jgi:diguanylate cyclase (GGDEF)-like protein
MAYGRSNVGASLRKVASNPRPSRMTSDLSCEVERLRSANTELLEEIAALKQREAETLRLAERDSLTGLYNRRSMMKFLDSAIETARTREQYVGLLFIDLNDFKAINDEYGHATGDKILITIAARISARVRTDDIVCRYGGDEFVVVLANIPDPAALGRVADAVRERITLPYWVNGDEQRLTAAIGESLFPHDADDGAALLRCADTAMYKLKSRFAQTLVSLGAAVPPRLARRRNDKSKPRSSGAL